MFKPILNNGFGCTDVGRLNHRYVNTVFILPLSTCISIIVLSCLCFLFIIGCERDEEDSSQTEALPVQQLESFSTQHREAGVLKWTLVGDSSKLVNDPNSQIGNEMIVQNPVVEIYEDGKISLKITSNIGKYYPSGENKNNLYLYGNVIGINEKGKLYTEELQWQNKDGTLYSPVEVKIVRGDSTWIGTEMIANPDLETVKMSNNRFRLYPKDEEINEKNENQ